MSVLLLSHRRMVGGGLLLSRFRLVSGRFLASASVGGGARSSVASAAAAASTASPICARLHHAEVEVGDAKTKPPTWRTKCRRDLSKGNLPKP